MSLSWQWLQPWIKRDSLYSWHLKLLKRGWTRVNRHLLAISNKLLAVTWKLMLNNQIRESTMTLSSVLVENLPFKRGKQAHPLSSNLDSKIDFLLRLAPWYLLITKASRFYNEKIKVKSNLKRILKLMEIFQHRISLMIKAWALINLKRKWILSGVLSGLNTLFKKF